MKLLPLSTAVLLALALFLSGCEMWEVSAARAAKKRESQTGPLMGELEQTAGVDDPLGRKQVDVDEKAEDMDEKAEGVGSRLINDAEAL